MENFKQALKRTTAILMIAVLLIGIAPIGSLADVDWSEFVLRASATNELAATGQCGENVYWNYNSETGELVINGTGPMYDYHEFDVRPFYQKDIKTVIINEGVTSIGNHAFYWCESLTSIEIPDSVTSIGDSAFEDCSSLTSIEIPGSVTSIGDYAFSDCDSLTSIEIPDSVTSIGDSAFSYCESLTSIEIPDSVTSIGDRAFSGCSSLTSIEIPDSVTSIGDDAFSDCYSLTSIEISDSVTSIGEDAFEDCDSLASIEIPDSVTSIGDDAFYSCDSLTSVEIPDSVTSIGSSAFEYCSSLTNIEIPDSVTSIGDSAFRYTAYYNDTDNWEDGVLYIGNHLIEVTDDKSGNCAIKSGTKTIADCAFYGCESLTSIEIPDSVTSIGDYAFRFCERLTSIEIPDSVTSIGDSAFYWCSGLTSIEIPGSVTSIGDSAFRYCDSLASIEIPDSVTSIGDYAFEDCESLTSIEIPDSVTSIGVAAFFDTAYYNDTDNWEDGVLYIGNHLIEVTDDKSGNYAIKSGTKTIAGSAFEDCESLASIEIPDSVTSIGYSAFRNCDSLTSVEIPDSVTSIGDYAFYDCYRLTSIEIPDSVTSIGVYAFYYCYSLTSIQIPSSVTSIGNFAFQHCDSLTDIYYNGSEEAWNVIDVEIYDENADYYFYQSMSDYVAEFGPITDAHIHFNSNNQESHTHSYTSKITTPATCTATGTRTYTCSCGDSYTEEIKATGHNEATLNAVAATCTSTGLTEGKKCSVCGEILVAQQEIAKENHTYDNDKDATCNVCGDVREIEIHNHSYTSKITTYATCTTTGTRTYTCSCGDSYTEEIKATGKHTGGTATCKAKAICTVCKQPYGELAKHNEVTVAGTPATYTTEGKTEGKKCSVCGTVTLVQQTIEKLTLGKVDGLKAKKVKVAKKSEITLTWNSVGEGVKYEVYQKNGKKWKKLTTTSKTSYIVKKDGKKKSLKADKEYQFRVRAVVDDIKGKYSSTLKVETIPATTTLKLKAGKKQLTASWSSVSGISGYEVQYSTSKKMKSAKTVNAKKSAKKTTIKKLKKGKKYFVRVRAYKTVDGKKIYSDWSKVKNVKVK